MYKRVYKVLQLVNIPLLGYQVEGRLGPIPSKTYRCQIAKYQHNLPLSPTFVLQHSNTILLEHLKAMVLKQIRKEEERIGF